MSTNISLIQENNLVAMSKLFMDTTKNRFDLIYADYIYNNKDFSWVKYAYDILKQDGIFVCQTDYRSVAEIKVFLDRLFYCCGGLINWCIWPYNWGGRPKNAFGRKHDDILIYSKGKKWKFYEDRVQIAKKTAKTGFNKNNKDTQIPTDVWSDIGNFHTMDSERIKVDDIDIHWQKPIRLMERIILPFTDEGDWVLDPFAGTFTTGVVCKTYKRNCVGIEDDPKVAKIAIERLGLQF